jgi:hypothetical protein
MDEPYSLWQSELASEANKLGQSIIVYYLLDEISNVPPDGEASGPEAAGETPLCSDQETAIGE